MVIAYQPYALIQWYDEYNKKNFISHGSEIFIHKWAVVYRRSWLFTFFLFAIINYSSKLMLIEQVSVCVFFCLSVWLLSRSARAQWHAANVIGQWWQRRCRRYGAPNAHWATKYHKYKISMTILVNKKKEQKNAQYCKLTHSIYDCSKWKKKIIIEQKMSAIFFACNLKLSKRINVSIKNTNAASIERKIHATDWWLLSGLSLSMSDEEKRPNERHMVAIILTLFHWIIY